MNHYNLGDIVYELNLETHAVQEFIVNRIMICVPDADEPINKSGIIYFNLDDCAMYQELLFPSAEIAQKAADLINSGKPAGE